MPEMKPLHPMIVGVIAVRRAMQLFGAALLALASVPACAHDISLPLTDAEQQALVQVLDTATRSGTTEQAKLTVYFLNKMQVEAARALPPPAPPPPPASAPLSPNASSSSE